MPFSITNTTRKSIPRVQFEEIKDHILGKDYELSLVFSSDALSKKLNRAYRGKDKPTNVLSFTLSETSGEIFINLSRLKGFSVVHLFVHGCLHLKGMEHSDTMEQTERKILYVASTRHWY